LKNLLSAGSENQEAFHAGGARNRKTEARKEAVQSFDETRPFDETQAFVPSVFSSLRLCVKLCFRHRMR
jgi:hypothetical protein